MPDLVLDGQIWRIATWPVPNPPDIWLVIMLAVFWYFGTEVEGLLGRVRFAVFIGLVTVIPGIVALPLIDLPQYGIRPVELCVFLLFVAEYPFVRFFFGIPGWVIGAVILGIEILQLLGERNEKGIVFLFVALAVAAVTARTMGLLTNYPWVPALPIGALGQSRRTKRSKSKKSRSRRSGGGDVVAGPWTGTSGRTDRHAAAAAAHVAGGGRPSRARRHPRQDLAVRDGRPQRRREDAAQRAVEADARRLTRLRQLNGPL